MGTSADGYFAAVAAWAVALLALAVTGHRPRTTGLASGAPLRAHRYLSYGLTLFAVIAGAVLLLGSRRLRPLPYVLAGLVVVPAGVHAARLQLVGGVPPAGRPATTRARAASARTATGCGRTSPARLLVVGPATVAGLRRAGAAPVRKGFRGRLRPGADAAESTARPARVRRAARPARRRPLRHEQGGDGTHLAAVRPVAAPGLRVPDPAAAPGSPPRPSSPCSSTTCC